MVEIEYKFGLDDLQQVYRMSTPCTWKLFPEYKEGKKYSVMTTYFDTNDHILDQQKAVLRRRSFNHLIEYSMKWKMKKQRDIERNEYTLDLSKKKTEHNLFFNQAIIQDPYKLNVDYLLDQPDFMAEISDPLRQILQENKQQFSPVFLLTFARQQRFIKVNQSEIEVDLDQGFYHINDKQIPFLELEIELKAGSLVDLKQLKEWLISHYQLTLKFESKYETGKSYVYKKR